MKKKMLGLSVLVILASVRSGADVPGNKDILTKVQGTQTESIEPIPDADILGIEINDYLYGAQVDLPGLNRTTGNSFDRGALLRAFGTRTTPDNMPVKPGDIFYYVLKGVGRSGVWERVEMGEAFAVVNGVPMKGLTIKGYGGNLDKDQQPQGSLSLSEARRDTLISRILMENGVDTYVGGVIVARPGDKSNFVRLSRTTHRMNDIIERKGQDLRSFVDYMTDLLRDEVGKKMTPEEFTQWLVKSTARAIAGKEYVGYKHGSQTNSNVGIGEMVDHGEGVYSPEAYFANASLAAQQLRTFRGYTLEAARNLVQEFQLSLDLDKLFDSALQERTQELTKRDAERVILDKATRADLEKLGLSKNAVDAIIENQSSLEFGILSTVEILQNRALTDADRKIISEKTGTLFERMSNGRFLPRSLVQELGGADLIRTTLTEVLPAIKDLTNQGEVTAAFKKALEARLTTAGRKAMIAAESGSWAYGAFPIANISDRIGRHVSWAAKNAPDLIKAKGASSNGAGAGSNCKVIFGKGA